MLAERYLQRRYREGRQDGREEGRQEGQRERDAAWTEWYERMVAAQERGEEFREPPPKLQT